MVTEDYVSFEIAKLLKEKGFDEATLCDYSDKGLRWFEEVLVQHNSQGGIACPTLQMAMKWLRDVHNLHIEIRITNHSISNIVNAIKYYWVMCDTENGRWCDESTIYTVKAFDTPQEAEEDAIRHALEKNMGEPAKQQ